MSKKRKNRRQGKFFIPALLISVLLTGGFVLYELYSKVYKPNIELKGNNDKTYFYISMGADFSDVYQSLVNSGYIKDTSSFLWVAKKMNYPSHVYPGRYLINDGIGNRELVKKLRSGKQEPVRVIINNVRTRGELAGLVAQNLELDSGKLCSLLNNEQYLAKWGFTPEDVLTMIFPNTYEFYWSTTAGEFLDRMWQAYRKFWNDKRSANLQNKNLSKKDAAILATIVQKESNKKEEWPVIAGVYLNRLNRGWKLQADPTVKHILHKNGKNVKRIYHKHLEINSPYNTYQRKGLPPGPIGLPLPGAIDAVLEAADHDYLFFCAKADLSGYHHFSRTWSQHVRYANDYHKALKENNFK